MICREAAADWLAAVALLHLMMAYLVLVDLAFFVQLEFGDAIKGALCLPGHPGLAHHCPPQPGPPSHPPSAAHQMLECTGLMICLS